MAFVGAKKHDAKRKPTRQVGLRGVMFLIF
jgi:hypothetical protein